MGKPKHPILYRPDFWIKNKGRTDVEIGKKLGIAPSTVRAARRRMNVQPISVSEASRRVWAKPDFRKERSEFPRLLETEFWNNERQRRTNSEIALEVGCSPSTVKKAREALGIRSLSRSEAQTRRFARDNPQSYPATRKKRGPMDPRIRAQSLQRAINRCEIPICTSHYKLEIDHVLDVQFFPEPSDADYLDNTLVLCFPHHDWWHGIKKKQHRRLRQHRSTPRQEAIKILSEYFPLD